MSISFHREASMPERSDGNDLPGPGPGRAGPSAALADFVDERSGLSVELHHPATAPGRWAQYLDGAEARYREHGVLRALDRPRIEDGGTTSLFFVAVDGDGRVVAGIRCHGPLRTAADACALRELAGHGRHDDLRAVLAGCLDDGLVEIKGAWVDPEAGHTGLSDALARCHVHAMDWFGARFAVCTSALTTARRWQTVGGRPLDGFHPVAYPDARYETVLLRWDITSSADLSDPAQWARLVDERARIAQSRRSRSKRGVGFSWSEFRPEVIDPRDPPQRLRLGQLLADPAVSLVDSRSRQLAELDEIVATDQSAVRDEATRFVHYPWRDQIVGLLGPHAFRTVRLDRNRNKITRAEQDRLGSLRVGVVGLSVGHSIAYTLVQDGLCHEIRLADFDTLELSNLNRIPAAVLDLGLSKAVALGRRIAELDPYVEVTVVPEGIRSSNVDRFVADLDVVIEECDSLDIKLLVREAARRARVPVIMETSDRGLLDVERFDLEPDRPVFHGLLGRARASDLVGLSTHDKVPYVLMILQPEQLSSRMAASMAEIDETLTTWPQLGSDVSLGAASVAAAVRRIGRGDPLPSGRVRIDLDAALDDLRQPERAQPPSTSVDLPEAPPSDPGLAVAHAATLAPSGGNSQPWVLRLDHRGLQIRVDRRHTVHMNVKFRGTYVAAGAALENARIAAAAHSLLGAEDRFPLGPDDDLVATLAFAHGDDPDLAALYPWVLARCTNRKAGARRPIRADEGAHMHSEAQAGGGRLHLLTSTDDLEDYAELLAESDRLRFLSPALHAELMRELRWPGDDMHGRGIDVRTLELDESDMSKLMVARRPDVMADLAAWDGGRALGQVTRDRMRGSSGLAVVTVAGSRREDYVEGGRALQRVWFAAQAAGLGLQPVSMLSMYAVDDEDFADVVPPAYVDRLRALDTRFRALVGLAEGEAVVLVLRLSHTDGPSVRSLRYPLSTALLQGPAGGSRQ